MIRKFMILIWMFILCLSIASAQDDDSDFGWTLVDVTPVDEIADNPRQARISPDGAMMVYDNEDGLCVYAFASRQATCAVFPQATPGGEPVDLYSHLAYHWSPDSRYVAFTENALTFFVDSDIWVYDVIEMKFIALTNDDFSGGLTRREDDTPADIDLVPIWNPTSGDLYFIRNVFGADQESTALYRIPRSGGGILGGVIGDEERVLDVDNMEEIVIFDPEPPFPFYNFDQGYSFNGTAAISPDGATLALLSRPQGPETINLVLVNLADGAISILATYPDIISPAFFPSWFENLNDGGLLPDGIAWMADNRVAVNIVNYQFDSILYNTLLTVDPIDGTVSGLVDHSATPSEEDYATTTDYAHPIMAVMSPDGEHVLYFNFASFVPHIDLSIVPINGGDPQVIHTFNEDDFSRIPIYHASAGADDETMRVLIFGYIFTFEQAS